jgi:hypothetical protein
MKKSFIFYSSWRNTFNMLTPEDAVKLINILCDKSEGIEPVIDSQILKVAFSQIEYLMNVNEEKRQEIIEKRREAGKKGGAPVGNDNAKKNNQNNQNQTKQTKQPDNVNVNVNVNDNVNHNINNIYTSTNILGNFEKKKQLRKQLVEIFSEEAIRYINKSDKSRLIKDYGEDKYYNNSQLIKEYVSIPF